MLQDVNPFERVWRAIRGDSPTTKAILSFVHFLERKLGAEMVYDTARLSSPNLELVGLFELAQTLHEAGVVLSWNKVPRISDEPPLEQWAVRYREGEESRAGGSALEDEQHALTCALAEALERHIWFETSDYFEKPTVATIRQIESKGRFIKPESFAGYSDEQREQHKNLRITPESAYLWIQAKSLTNKDSVWLPAQTVSPTREAQGLVRQGLEPHLRRVITTGLATHPSREEALLGGALEAIERDAYMVMWLNQLTLPRVDLDTLSRQSPSLKKLLERCKQYRLKPHVVRMLTDAPAYAFCAVVEDETGLEPRVIVGLKTNPDPARAAEGAIVEALRARRGVRNRLASSTPRPQTAKEVGHYDRLVYWAEHDRYKKLAFLYKGPLQQLTEEPWERGSPSEHLERITAWCQERKYEFASVPFTKSKKNVTPWHIEMVVIPPLQPIYFSETLPHLGGKRLSEIPKLFGYKVRTPLFTEEPHPFA